MSSLRGRWSVAWLSPSDLPGSSLAAQNLGTTERVCRQSDRSKGCYSTPQVSKTTGGPPQESWGYPSAYWLPRDSESSSESPSLRPLPTYGPGLRQSQGDMAQQGTSPPSIVTMCSQAFPSEPHGLYSPSPDVHPGAGLQMECSGMHH